MGQETYDDGRVAWTEDEKQLLPVVREKLDEIAPELVRNHQDWLTDRCVLRYIRARQGKVEKVVPMIHETLQWRTSYQPHALPLDVLKRESETGKNYVNGRDRFGRPIIYMKPRFENTHDHDGNLALLVHTLERACHHMQEEEGIEQWTLVVDYKDYSIRNAPPMKTTKATLSILQNHYPERLARAIMVDPPFLFWASWKVISPFIDPKTKEKVVFVRGKEDKKREIMADHLGEWESSVYGNIDRTYDHAEYWDSWQRGSAN